MFAVQGNKGRKVTQDLMAKLPSAQTNKRGITVDGMSTSSQIDWMMNICPR